MAKAKKGYLVLSRQKDEEIVIPTPAGLITICVVDIRGDKVRLGVAAPKELQVHRREVYDLLRAEARAAVEQANAQVLAIRAAVEKHGYEGLRLAEDGAVNGEQGGAK